LSETGFPAAAEAANRERKLFGRGIGIRDGVFSFFANEFVNLFPMDGNFRWCLDPEPDLIAANIDDRNNDVVSNDYALIALS
jgi:hypothetical protein